MSLVETTDRMTREPREPRPMPLRRVKEGNSFVRFVTAHAKAFVYKAPVHEIVREFWPQDQTTMYMVTRAATTPAQTRQTGWAAELAQRIVADITTALGPVSMGMRLLQSGLVLSFDRAASIAVPNISTGTVNTAAWVAERQPIPVFNPTVVAAIMEQHKMAGIIVLTREMIESSNAEALVADLATKAMGRALDEVLVDANPGDLARPPGLRYGISATTPSSATDLQEAFIADASKLLDAIAPVAGGARVAMIGSLSRTFRMSMRSYGAFDLDADADNFLMLPSAAVINDFLAVACAALVSVFGTEPEIEVGKVGSVNMNDAPAPDPTTPAAPMRSLWQSDSIAIKLRWPVTWALRDARGFAWMTPTAAW